MTNFLQFVALGVGVGAVYALFAQGVVLIYRGSGLVNLAHGAIGTLCAYVCFVTLFEGAGQIFAVSLVGGVLAGGLVALGFQAVILARLRTAAPIVRLISTLGLLAVLQGLVEVLYEPGNHPVDPFLPTGGFSIGDVRIENQRLVLLAIAGAVTAALWAFTLWTRTGLAISACARNELAAQTLGWSPDRLARLTWGLGGALAGGAMILAAPLTGLNPTTFTIVATVSALAAALLGGFQSFPLTLVGGLVVGIGETLATSYKSDIEDLVHQQPLTGLQRGVPFLIIALVLVVRGRGLPLRSHVADRLPRLGSGVVRPAPLVLVTGVLAAAVLFWFDDGWASATSVTLTAGVIVLSIVVLAGFTGQVSLAQWALGGVGALIGGRLIQAGWPVELAIVGAVLGAVPVGLVIALPALRTRGVNLTVLTLGLGFTISEVVLANPKWINGITVTGTEIGNVDLFGVDVNSTQHPHRWAIVCLAGLLVVGLVVANLRRSRTGQRLLAVRTNERAAASLGISVFSVKVYAFSLAAGMAAFAGVLLGFRSRVVTYDQFNVFHSINAVGNAVVGGLGYVTSAGFAGPMAEGGLGDRAMTSVLDLDEGMGLIGGLLLWLVILAHQHGVADAVFERVHERHERRRARRAVATSTSVNGDLGPVDQVESQSLSVSALTVRFGSVTALDGVDLRVEPGEVVGLIGPNGAGKTTLIDAVTGFVRPTAGTIAHGSRSNLAAEGAAARARGGVRRSFQSLELFDDLTVAQNLQAGALAAPWWSWITDLVRPGRHPLPSAALAAVEAFELRDVLDTTPDELPYGRRRLVGIARAVAAGPSTVLLDEPAAGLDGRESRDLSGLIRALAHERGMGVLLVEHDVALVMQTCDRVVVLDFGRVIADGSPAEVRHDPAVRAAYLGEVPTTVAVGQS
jgi:ABC-type branched-subunit amino acid transport system ATPase component/branched-subunit amino acid ABC-type transport system permease component